MARAHFIVHVSVLICLTVGWCAPVNSFIFGTSEKATVTPVDAYVFIGETLKVQCKLTSRISNIATSDISFVLFFHDSNISWTVPQENITFIDNRTITAELKITDNYSYYTTLACQTKDITILYASEGIYVERPIQNITNFTGVFYYYGRTGVDNVMTTWSLGETYLEPDMIQVDINWNPNLPSNLSGGNCTDRTDTSCTIYPSGQDIILYTIKVWSKRADKRPNETYLVHLYETHTTSIITFVLPDNMKTIPPQLLRVVDKTSTCVNILWNTPPYYTSSINLTEIYRIEIKMEDEKEFQPAVASAVRPNLTDIVQLCELVPYTRYFLSVQVKAKDINPWSDQAIVEFTMEEDRPSSGPPLTDTSYHAEECVKSVRQVLLYWNDPPKTSLQGQLTRFEVENDNRTVPLRVNSNYYQASLDCSSTNEIRVYSATKVGRSIKPSYISIPKKSDELTVTNDLELRVEDTSIDSGVRSLVNVSITWDPADVVENTSIILYMCQDSYIPNTCFNDFTTKEINVDQERVIINDLPSSTNMFGYALRDGIGQKRGIQWTNCVYRANLRPTKPAPLQVSTGSQANTLFMSWTSTQCSKTTKVLILFYHLYICSQPVEDVKQLDGNCLNHTIGDMSISSYTVTNLKGGQSYYVYILAESPAGLGLLSDRAVGTPNTPNTDSGLIVGAVSGTLIGVLVLGSLLFCSYRSCINSKKRLEYLIAADKTDVPVTCRQNSDESGIYTDSSNSRGSGKSPAVPPRGLELVIDPQQVVDPKQVVELQQIDPITTSGTGEHVQGGEANGACADIVNNLDSSKDVNDKCVPYMILTNKCLSGYITYQAPVNDFTINSTTPEAYNSSGVAMNSPTNTVCSKQLTNNILVPHLHSTVVLSQNQNALIAESDPLFSSQSSALRSPIDTTINTPTHATCISISHVELQAQCGQSAASFLETTTKLPTPTESLGRQSHKGEDESPSNPKDDDDNPSNLKGEGSSPSQNLSADYVLCHPDGTIDPQKPHLRPDIDSGLQEVFPHLGMEDEQTAETTFVSQGQNSTLSSTQEDYVRQAYPDTVQDTSTDSEQSMDIFNVSFEQMTYCKQQTFGSYTQSTVDESSQYNDNGGIAAIRKTKYKDDANSQTECINNTNSQTECINNTNSQTECINNTNSQTECINNTNSQTECINNTNSQTECINNTNSQTECINNTNSQTECINNTNSQTECINNTNSQTECINNTNSQTECINNTNSQTECINNTNSQTECINNTNSQTDCKGGTNGQIESKCNGNSQSEYRDDICSPAYVDVSETTEANCGSRNPSISSDYVLLNTMEGSENNPSGLDIHCCDSAGHVRHDDVGCDDGSSDVTHEKTDLPADSSDYKPISFLEMPSSSVETLIRRLLAQTDNSDGDTL